MHSAAPPTGLLTIAESARLLRVSESTIRRWARRGDLDVLRLGDGPTAPVRVPVAALVGRLRVASQNTNGEEPR
jgi:excisionase family DNA binding protein